MVIRNPANQAFLTKFLSMILEEFFLKIKLSSKVKNAL